MSGFGSQISEESGSWLWPCCQNCGCRKTCPYVYDQILCHAACQSRDGAQQMTKAAGRFLETISHSDDVRCLLNGSMNLEKALFQALSLETGLMDTLCTQTAKYCW